MERWDLLDENGRPTGERMVRGEPIRPGRYHRVVHVWVMDSTGRLLIQKRAPFLRLMPGEWTVTSGSAVAGEDSRQAAARELGEELGIHVRPEELEFLFGTAEMRVALFPLLRGHTQLVLLARAEGIHAFTRTNHAFWPGLSLPAPRLAAKALCCLLQKNSTPEKLPRLTTRQLQTIL